MPMRKFTDGELARRKAYDHSAKKDCNFDPKGSNYGLMRDGGNSEKTHKTPISDGTVQKGKMWLDTQDSSRKPGK